MKRIILCALSFLIILSFTLINVSANDIKNTGKYSAQHYIDKIKSEFEKEIPAISKALKRDLLDTKMSKFYSYDITSMYKMYWVEENVLNLSSEKTLKDLTNYKQERYELTMLDMNSKPIGTAVLIKNADGEFIVLGGTDGAGTLFSYDDILNVVTESIGDINNITVLQDTVYGSMYVSVETDQEKYIIPYGVQTKYVHLENGKAYTEKRAQEIMNAFLKVNPNAGYNSEGNKVYGAAPALLKKPSEAQVKSLGLTENELAGYLVENQNLTNNTQIGYYIIISIVLFGAIFLIIKKFKFKKAAK